jgi:cytochrome P450
VRTPSGPGEAITVADLETDPHPSLARLRDARAFTVDDPRFSTAKVVGPSMLSLDGAQHARHRAPFTRPFRADEVHARLESFIRDEAGRLVAAIRPRGAAELRRAVAGPLAAAVMAEALGLGQTDPATVLGWYDGIVAAVQAEAAAAGRAPGEWPSPGAGPDQAGSTAAAGSAAFAALAARLGQVIAAGAAGSVLAEAVLAETVLPQAVLAEGAGPLTEAEAISNAAVLLFGGIETTEGMIANAMLHLLSSPAELEMVLADRGLIPAAVEESLRLEPAAAVVDRYATRDTRLGHARIRAGDQVTVSIAGANRDPAVFGRPDVFDIRRPDPGRQLAFAHGPHFCLGVHLARLEARIAVQAMLEQLPGLHLDPRSPSAPAGLVFRKPTRLSVCWNPR